jgi:predicted O-linked N-acetylglucosamine transferase (SPINDLY family)
MSNAERDAWMREATRLHQSGRLDDAWTLYARVLDDDPHDADALHLSGLIAYKRGNFDDALARIERAITFDPDNAVFHGNLGNVQKDGGRSGAAIASYRRALAIDAAQIPARNNLGVLLLAAGDTRAAVDAFRDVIARKPDHFRAQANLGKALIASGDAQGAEAALRRALTLSPQYAEAFGDLGLLLQRQGRRDEAVALFRRRTAIEPDSSIAYADLALALHQADDLEGARTAYARAAALAPLTLQAISNRCALLQKICDWEQLDAEMPRVQRALTDGAPGVPVGLTVSLPGITPHIQWMAARNNAAAFVGRPPLATPRAIDQSRRLRVGYLSADFRAHATAYLASEVFELHDRDRHEVVLFSYGPDDGSPERARLVAAADAFVDVAALDDLHAAQRIFEHGVDILVDLNGATDNGRMGIAAWRPAPIQVNWLGFPGTLGAPFYDYLVADRHVIPPGEDREYDETIVRLPVCYTCRDRRQPSAQIAPTRAANGLPDDAIVLCCLNQSYKITADVFAAWMRVLAAVPAAVLWLYDDNPLASEALGRRAAAAGVDPSRLAFAPRLPQSGHVARYALADFAVDTFPCTSHTTASDALWMGCPLVTIRGGTFAARVAASLLDATGLPDLATPSLAAYEACVIDLARDASRRDALRGRIADAATAAPLFDTPRFVRDLEAAYAAMAAASPARIAATA